jgi:hypothetical protein
MNRNLSLFLCAAIVLIVPNLCQADEVFPVVHNEPITVRVLGGRDGRPQPHLHVVLTGGYGRRDLALAQWREEAITDQSGAIQLSKGLRNLPLLRVEVLHGHACAAEPAGGLSVELIRRDGMSGANHCGIKSVLNEAGVLTLYVKGLNPSKNVDLEDVADSGMSYVSGSDPVSGSVDALERQPRAHTEPRVHMEAQESPLAGSGAAAVSAASQAQRYRTAADAPEAGGMSDGEMEQLLAEQP